MYFSDHESVRNCLFKSVMSSHRFDLLSRFLHFAQNNSTACERNVVERKLAKVKPLIDLLLKKQLQSNYIPKKNIVEDESQLGWKGILSFLQYIPTKRKRFGIRFYELCESDTGYVWNFLIYRRKDTMYTEQYKHLPTTEK